MDRRRVRALDGEAQPPAVLVRVMEQAVRDGLLDVDPAVPPGLAVGAVHLHYGDGVGGEEPGDLRAVGAGSLDSDSEDHAMRLQPVQQSAVAVRGGLELLGGQVTADAVDDRGLVEIGMGVDPTDHRYVLCCHAVVYCPSNAHEWEGT